MSSKKEECTRTMVAPRIDSVLSGHAVAESVVAVSGGSVDARNTQAELHGQIAHLYSIERVNGTIFYRAFNNYFNRLILSMMPRNPEAKILDMMGGAGLLSQAILEAQYKHVILMDLTVEMLGFAKQTLGNAVRVCSGDALRIPVKDESLDLVICRGGLHHLPDLVGAAREIHRVLKKNGTFLSFDPCDDLPLIQWLRRVMYRMFSFFDDEHERGLTSKELAAAFVQGGLAVKEMRKFGFVGYTVSGIEAHLFPRLFAILPRANVLGDWLCKIDEKLEGSRFLLATAVRAVKE